MRNDIREMVLETIEGFYKAGTVSEITLKEIKAMCLPKLKPYTNGAIVKIRKRLKLSQAALAMFLNTSTSTIQKWEQGDKKPSGSALKLLHLIDEKGLAGIV